MFCKQRISHHDHVVDLVDPRALVVVDGRDAGIWDERSEVAGRADKPDSGRNATAAQQIVQVSAEIVDGV